jgi:hypothetical protein
VSVATIALAATITAFNPGRGDVLVKEDIEVHVLDCPGEFRSGRLEEKKPKPVLSISAYGYLAVLCAAYSLILS